MDRARTIAFIDNSNIFSGQLNAGWRIDARELRDYLEREGKLWQVFFFASVTDPPRYQQTGFYNTLRQDLRWEVFRWAEKPFGATGAVTHGKSRQKRALMSLWRRRC